MNRTRFAQSQISEIISQVRYPKTDDAKKEVTALHAELITWWERFLRSNDK